jgi:thymidylate synthase (FAD)
MSATLIVVKPGHELFTPPAVIETLLSLVEESGRVCYKSEDRIGEGSAEKFVRSVVKRGHESVIEHGNITVKIICDRSCSHQLVRHRIAAYSQESQRYCDYAGKQGREGLRVICPPSIALLPEGLYDPKPYVPPNHPTIINMSHLWMVTLPDGTETKLDRVTHNEALLRAEKWLLTIARCYQVYRMMRDVDVPPEDARSVLPNAVKTEVVTTFNLRQWRHVFKERALNPHAQWQIRQIMRGILSEFAELLPPVFGDLWDKAKGDEA